MINAYIIIAIGVNLFLFAFKFKNSKRVALLMVVYLFIIYTFCNGGSPDLSNYIMRYNDQVYGTAIGFDLLMQLFSFLGIGFVAFKAVIGSVFLIILYKTISRCTKNVAMVLALFSIFPFLSSVAQIRNGLMAIIILYSLVVFIQDPKHDSIRYTIGVLIASLIHPTALFYLIFLISKKTNRLKVNTKVFLFLLFIASVVYIFVSNMLFDIVSDFVGNEKYLSYFDFMNMIKEVTPEVLNWKGKLLPMIGQLSGYVGLYFILSSYKGKLSNKLNRYSINHSYQFNLEQLDMINTMFLLTFLLLPFYLISPTYFRIFKNIIPLLYIVDAQYLDFNELDYDNAHVKFKHYYIILYAIMVEIITAYGIGYALETLDSFSLL